MKTRFVGLAVIIGSQIFSSPVHAATSDLKKCIGALNAFEKAIKGGSSKLDSKWLRGMKGSIFLNLAGPHEPMKELSDYVGATKDITLCSAFGMTPEEINVFLLAYHGYLPADPFEDVSRCYSVMLLASPQIEKKLGNERAQSFGYAIGEKCGGVTAQLNFLFSAKQTSIQEVQKRAAEISKSLAPRDKPTLNAAIKSNLARCAWYGVPLADALASAGITASNP